MRYERLASRAPAVLALGLLGAVGGPTSASGQQDLPLETDRPDFTDGTTTIPGGHTQLEAGYTYARDDEAAEHTLGELLVRIGFGPNTELRVGFDSYAWSRGPARARSGFTDTSLGIKLNVLRGTTGSLRPAVALVAASSLPTGDRTFGESRPQPEAKLAIGWQPTDRLAVGSNLNYAYASDADVRFHRLAGSLAFAYAWTDRIGTFIEGYGLAPTDADDVDSAYLNGGLTYRVSPRFQLDARAGVRAEHADDQFFGVGMAYRW